MTGGPEDGALPLRNSEDLARMRRRLGALLDALEATPGSRARLLTAATELGRNVIRHAGGGWMRFEVVDTDGRRGVRLEFEDEGPGIADLERAWQDGFSTAGGLGLGLGGSRRLLRGLSIEPREPRGTRVTGTEWLDRTPKRG